MWASSAYSVHVASYMETTCFLASLEDLWRSAGLGDRRFSLGMHYYYITIPVCNRTQIQHEVVAMMCV
jgi:hypothetical protein